MVRRLSEYEGTSPVQDGIDVPRLTLRKLNLNGKGKSMEKVIREGAAWVGVDLAKRVIQVHGVDAAGRVASARAIPRNKFVEWCAGLPHGCVVAMEACSGAHH